MAKEDIETDKRLTPDSAEDNCVFPFALFSRPVYVL
jgi:hypothetical protein